MRKCQKPDINLFMTDGLNPVNNQCAHQYILLKAGKIDTHFTVLTNDDLVLLWTG